MDIPRTVDDITAEWLTEALRAGGYLDDGRVESVEFERIGIGLGFASTIVRCTVEYSCNAGGAPKTLVAKLLSGHAETDAMVKSQGTGHREVRFFEELAPDVGVPVPEKYYADSDQETGEFILLLEDLSGARLGDDVNGVSPEDAELVVDNLARMHARWWNSDRLRHLDWMDSPADPGKAAKAGDDYRSAWEKVSNGIASRFPDGVFDIAEKFGVQFENVMRPIGESPITLNHGDCRLGNLFFRNQNGASEVVRIDWQRTSSSRGATDLAYFIVFSFPVDQRRSIEDSLLRLYLRVLTENGVHDYSYDQLIEDYRRGLFRFLFIAVIALGNVDFDNEGGRAIVDAALPRLTALIDWDCGALIPD